MIVEIIGSTSSGKSTIINGLRTSWKTNFPGGSIVCVSGNYYYDFISLPWFLKFAAKHKKICILAGQSILKNVSSPLNRLNLYRNFIKKMGTNELIQTRIKDNDILWDEGPVHAAHNLFVHTNVPPVLSDIDKFAKLVPLPDLIVYLKAPVDEIVSRMGQRGGHARVRKNNKEMRIFCEHAAKMFEYLISIDRIREKTIIVENLKNNRQAAIDETLRVIMGKKATYAG